jgi:hypothetical protein
MRDSFRTLADDADGRLLAVRVRLIGVASVHPILIARRAAIAENTQSALHHVFEDAWLEKFVIESREPEEPRVSDPLSVLIDAGALLAGLETGPEMQSAAAELIEEIGGQWPSQQEFANTGLADELDQLLAEARTLVLARASGKSLAPTVGD